MHSNSKLLFKKYGVSFIRANQTILEIGPDAIPSSYRECVSAEGLRWETIEIQRDDKPGPQVDHVATSEYAFPLPDAAFDIVLSGQVIEHVRKIWTWYRELARVCRSGGHVITVCPVTWPYHEDPVDCWRIYPEGMKALCEDAGLEPVLIRCESAEPLASLLAQRWFLSKQTLKAWMGVEPFLAPLLPALSRTLDTIAVARKP